MLFKVKKKYRKEKSKSGEEENRKNNTFVNCSLCNSKKSKFIKEKEAKGLSSSIGIKKFVSQIPLLGPLLF